MTRARLRTARPMLGECWHQRVAR